MYSPSNKSVKLADLIRLETIIAENIKMKIK